MLDSHCAAMETELRHSLQSHPVALLKEASPTAPGPLVPSKGRQAQVCATSQPRSTTGWGCPPEAFLGMYFSSFLQVATFWGNHRSV